MPFVPVRESLAKRLGAMPELRFALLFGSRARDDARQSSDWDIAIYLEDGMDAGQRFRTRVRLAAELEDLGRVDVVVLNDADPLLAQRALQGQVIQMADRRGYVRFFVRTLALAEDQRYFDRILARARAKRLAEGTYGRP
jgi:predicted nucleotidyltransferase